MECSFKGILVASTLLLLVQFSSLVSRLTNTNQLRKRLAPVKRCAMNDSATVLEALETEFYPIIAKHNTTLTEKCLFAKHRSLYGNFEDTMIQTAEHQGWQCQTCGKYFYTKIMTWKHMLRKHPELLNEKPTSVCFADFCDIFRCHLRLSYPVTRPSSRCNEKELLAVRRRCETIVRDCLPSSAHKAYDDLWRLMCSTLTCEKFYQPFEDSISIWTVVVLSICIPITLCVAMCLVCHIWDQCWDVEEERDHTTVPRNQTMHSDESRRIKLAHSKGLDLRRRTMYR